MSFFLKIENELKTIKYSFPIILKKHKEKKVIYLNEICTETSTESGRLRNPWKLHNPAMNIFEYFNEKVAEPVRGKLPNPFKVML